MKITKNENGTLTFQIDERLDINGSEKVKKELYGLLDGVGTLELDLDGLDYVSSAGLRLLLIIKKKIDAKGGTMKLLNVSPEVMKIFQMTGFDRILSIEMKPDA